MLRDFVRLSYEFVRLSYEFVRQSYEFERQPSDDRYRHSKHLIDIHMYKPDDIPNSYVVRTDAVGVRTTVVIIRTAVVRSQPIASMLQEKWACRNPPCDVALDRTNSYDSRTISCEFLAVPFASDRKTVVRLM